ncbi:MAG: M4 family metallopeptidase [Bacteroidota bacterium]
MVRVTHGTQCTGPKNGGTRLGDPGWQPKSVAEQFRGREDNGGVHINSGIPNHAFYLFATDTRVGRDRAEVVFYKALTDYLSSSSNFTDLRRAVRQSIVDIFGNNEGILDAFTSAFDQVGIEGDGTTTAPEPEITTFEVNPGEEFVLWYRRRTEQFVLRTVINEIDAVISTRGLSNIPSVSDDGRIIVFIGSDRNMYAILIDPDTGALSERLISNSREWRNVAISKDGTKIAAVSGNLSNGEFDNRILIVDLISETQQWYELSNPTTAEGISTGDVRFADALVWDHTSQFVMYDAANEISSLFGDPISYWDIGFLRAWDAQNDTYGDGSIAKLFPSLPENVSVGNPTFTHASPDIIAMDLLDSRSGETEYSIIGVNLETSDQGLLFENNTVGYPRYSTRDDAMLFNFQRTTDEIVGILETNADRISSPGEGFLYAEDGRWGVWFSNGQRDLTTSVNEIISDDRLKIFPNPAGDHIQVSIESQTCSNCAIRIYNTEGQLQLDQVIDEDNEIDDGGLSGGIYTLLLRNEDGLFSQKFIKW